MTLLEIARIYTDLVRAEREIPQEEPQAKEKINALRTKYHDMLMTKMRDEKIDFSDRFDAANKAFELVREAETKYGPQTEEKQQ
jgi:hypothetical protein